MKHELSNKEKGIIRSIRTAPLTPIDRFEPIDKAEVEYPKVKVTRIVDRMSGDEEIIFDPIRR